uniref:Uncharacterized protein n=1 Tax=Arion vulgaris TaxID=1028688 RepID=A0A0B6YWK2_9EUPU
MFSLSMDIEWENENMDIQRRFGEVWNKELKECGLTWITISRAEAEWQQWRFLVQALCVKWDTKKIYI